MRVDGRVFEHKLRSAAQAELVGPGGEQLFTDLSSHLNRDVIDAGFGVNFGSDREAFASVVAALGIQDMLNEDTGTHHIHNAVCYGGPSTGFIGKTIPSLRKLDVVDAVDAAQADKWWVKDRDMYPYIKPDVEVIGSHILVTAKGETTSDGDTLTDVSQPGFAIGALYRYHPDFENDCGEPFGEGSLPYFLRGVVEPLEDPSKAVMAIAEQIEYGRTLAMPKATYYLRYGRAVGAYPVGNIADVSYPQKNGLVVDNGRVERIKPRSDDLE